MLALTRQIGEDLILTAPSGTRVIVTVVKIRGHWDHGLERTTIRVQASNSIEFCPDGQEKFSPMREIEKSRMRREPLMFRIDDMRVDISIFRVWGSVGNEKIKIGIDAPIEISIEREGVVRKSAPSRSRPAPDRSKSRDERIKDEVTAQRRFGRVQATKGKKKS